MAQLHFAKYRRDSRYTHYLFRFPAKFHPPVIRYLIDQYSEPKDAILDPFCGSGTLLVEALIAGRNAVGIDIDPVATFISKVKSKPIPIKRLTTDFEALRTTLSGARRSASEYDRLMFADRSYKHEPCHSEHGSAAIRERTGEGHKRAMAAGVKFGRKRKLSDYQRKEAIKRRNAGETLASIAKSYAVDISMISRL